MALSTCLLQLLFFCLMDLTARGSSSEVSVWTFRNDNVDNAVVKATYSGPNFASPIDDYSICFRYQILFFSPGNRGINVWTAKNGKETLHLRLFNDKWANKFEVKTENGDRHVIWFDAEVKNSSTYCFFSSF